MDSRDLATEEKDTDLADKEMPKKVNDKKQNRYLRKLYFSNCSEI